MPGDMSDELLDQIRELHAPIEQHLELSCKGCDWGGWEGEEPGWPCRTARLVYSTEEVVDVLEAIELANKWSTQRYLCTSPHYRGLGHYPWLEMGDRFIADVVFPKVSVARGEITYKFAKEERE